MNFNKSYQKYLKKMVYKNLPNKKFQTKKDHYKYFFIIPIYNEYPNVLKTLDSINKQQIKLLNDTLVILVVNNKENSDIEVINNNDKSYKEIKNKKYFYESITLDFYSIKKSLPESQFGVGVARKIGMDFILTYAKKTSLIFSLDADTIISKNYLSIIVDFYHLKKFQACTINFKHLRSNDSIINKGIKIYEKALYHMAGKIKESGSPYGYVSMGSAIVCTVEAYIAIGGMCQKDAAEDFYFMQSLAKFTNIYNIKDYLVYPSSRCEQRVHLGTGYRMKEFKKNQKFKNLFFHDSSYNSIKKLIVLVEKNYNQSYEILNKELNQYFDHNICNFLYSHRLNNIWDKINQNAKSKKQFMLFFHQWFDALKIMKFLRTIN